MDSHDERAPPVEVRNLTKRYKGGTWANRDITLKIARGELLGILGPNGAGKATLVRQITTELLPTSCQVLVFEHDVVSEPNVVKGYMGVMPQEANLYWGPTVRHHLHIFSQAARPTAQSRLLPHRGADPRPPSGRAPRQINRGAGQSPLDDSGRADRGSRPTVSPRLVGPAPKLQTERRGRAIDHSQHG